MSVFRDLWRAWRYGVTWPIMALLLAASAGAQTLPPSPQGLTAQFSATCAASTCATWSVGNATSVTVSVTGAGSWTGTFYASSDGGNSYFAATMVRLSDRSMTQTVTDTGDGQYAITNSGITHLQFRLTTWASGGANVWAIRGYGSVVGQSPFANPVIGPASGTCVTPAFSFTGDTDSGMGWLGANNPAGCAGGATSFDWNTTRVAFALPVTIAQGTLTADAQALSTTATWNNAGVTFTHWKANVTNTASNAASNLIDVQVGGSSKFTVRASGLNWINPTGGTTSGTGLAIGSNVVQLLAPTAGVFLMTDSAGTDFSRLQFGGTTSSFVAAKRVGTALYLRLADDSAAGGLGFASLAVSGTAPTIASGGCTSPAVTWNNGTATFLVTIGTSCAGVKTFVLTMPAATTGWAVDCANNTSDAAQQTNYAVARSTSTTAVVVTSYDRVTGLQEDFTASDSYLCKASGG